jgi:hypothetical protein
MLELSWGEGGKRRIGSRQAHTRHTKRSRGAKGKSGRKDKRRRRHNFCCFSFLFCCCCGGGEKEREREREGRRMGDTSRGLHKARCSSEVQKGCLEGRRTSQPCFSFLCLLVSSLVMCPHVFSETVCFAFVLVFHFWFFTLLSC